MAACEVNFDGLIGPTHNYAGLSAGNLASVGSADQVSNPQKAALEGLAKMKALFDMGLKQAIIPPLDRPDIDSLRLLGFGGTDVDVINQAAQQIPNSYASFCSASSMWVANACTVSPSSDTSDGRVHFTVANLASKFHRSIESPATSNILRAIFPTDKYFAHHERLPPSDLFGDEGAANHTRFCGEYSDPGVELFVYGVHSSSSLQPRPTKFRARQSLEASQAIARLHGLCPARTIFAQQNPAVIDLGVFHNDVISVGNQNCFFYHERAFLAPDQVVHDLQAASEQDLVFISVPDAEISIEDAVRSYLFNSQLVTLPSGRMAILAPEECKNSPRIWSYLNRLLASGSPIEEVQTYNLKESMRNGGGPACLRLRVVLNEVEISETNKGVFMTESLFQTLTAWIKRYYRESLAGPDLADPQLLLESRTALDELTQILRLGTIYRFQL